MNINWYPGHMKKTREMILQELKLVDLVYEMVDARIPVSSRNPDIDELIGEKPRILLLNKADLADAGGTKEWMRYFSERKIPCVAIDTPRRKGFSTLFSLTEEAMQAKKARDAGRGIKNTRTRVMVAGIPNVGKSSLINRIAEKKSAKTGNKPGVTKSKQWIRAQNHMELLDTPGVLWPKLGEEKTALHLAFTGAITDRILDEETLGYRLLELGTRRRFAGMIDRYGAPEEDTLAYMEKIGRARGYLLRGGLIDYEKTGQLLLDEFRGGLWGGITLETP
ncbi:MAG: ribosome biogenesis GTPase YlqF [Tissierellia bacterium]|jgi:ribosome biogenesis GTPase A|nr:ribosome biogenesis GTPase YlqF [Bacillota bacterium]NLK58759.1 ribosome biogenesis GTPase YlqF [Tissierellia bacterium]